MEENFEILTERRMLAQMRLEELANGTKDTAAPAFFAENGYFSHQAKFMTLINKYYDFILSGEMAEASLETLEKWNLELFSEVFPANYETSFVNPSYAVARLGDLGRLFSAVAYELRSCIGFAADRDLKAIVIRMELLLELEGIVEGTLLEEGKLPGEEGLRETFYYFVSDYADEATEKRIANLVCPGRSIAMGILEDADLSDIRYLYRYGCYVSSNETELARFMADLREEEVALMADTYTEGYRLGFEMTGKDLSIKETAEIRYPLGLERMMRRAIANLRALDIEPVLHRPAESQLYQASPMKIGFVGGNPNRQCDYDHKNDKALFFDRNYVNRLLEVTKTAFTRYKIEAKGYAGPAVVEGFGEETFEPVNKKENLQLSPEQNRLMVEYRTKMGELQRQFIIEEERSFTIIAFPLPEIARSLKTGTYADFFREIIRVNTLDYQVYQKLQADLIDALNKATHCRILGRGENRTDLTVSLYPLTDPSHQTIFENCVADVNIPVGEVFTSPVLEGTNGVLHVTRVFLEGLEYKDLEIAFENGRIKAYSCANFPTEKENKTFIEENILFRHPTLPMGEFAIGTNTTAYVVARKYGVEDKLPILIAEKTGPHFAVGDTCYSHVEDIAVFNPDGKEIVARDNEISLLRKTDSSKAYFNCHTDITIPYEELGSIVAYGPKGYAVTLLENGRFVLPGTEILNVPLDN